MFSPEHRLFDYEDTTMSMMRNVQIVWNCRNARCKAIKEDTPAFKQVTLTKSPFVKLFATCKTCPSFIDLKNEAWPILAGRLLGMCEWAFIRFFCQIGKNYPNISD
jgi:hypothetical protein